jgi:adenylate cyclase
MAELRVRRRLAAILAADVVGYSRLMGADEEGTLASFNAHFSELVSPTIADHHGRIIKTTGDGILAEFDSVVDAVRCAILWQQEMHEREAGVPVSRRIQFRIGINLGDVIIQDSDVFGDGVNIAARMEGLADPGGICISGTAYDHLHGKLPISFVDMGEQAVKNITRPIRAYRITDGASDLARSHRLGTRPVAAILLTIAVMAMLGSGIYAWSAGLLSKWSQYPDGRISTATDRPSIAVLPFANLSHDASQDFFADGISEDIMVELSKSSGLLVIARNSSFAYKGSDLDVAQISQALGVRYLLTGSVRRDRDRVRVNVELIDCNTAAHVWAERFDRNAADIFAVQDEITEKTIVTLVSEVTRAEIDRARRKPPANLDAYENYLRGLELFRARATRPPWGKTLKESRDFLELSIRQDPGFGLAWAALAENYVSAWIQPPHYGPLEAEHQHPETLSKALAAAEKAIQVEPSLAEGYAKKGWVLHWMRRPEEAQAAYRRAFEINPNLLDDAYPNALIKFGRHAEAIAYLDRQIRIDPAFGRNYGNLGLAHYLQSDYEEAITSLEACKRLAAGWRACNIWIAAVLAEVGRTSDAKTEAEIVSARDKDFSVTRWVAFEPYSRKEDSDHLSDGLLKAGFAR